MTPEEERVINAALDNLGIDSAEWEKVAGGKVKITLLTGSTGRPRGFIYVHPVEFTMPGHIEDRLRRLSESVASV